MRKIGKVVILMGLLLPHWASSQDFSNVLSAGIEDAELYLKDYIDPFMTGFGYGTANGWYNTAKPHQPLGFDFTLTTSLAFVPEKDLFFDFEGFENITVENGPTRLPTIFGPKAQTNFAYDTRTEVEYEDPDPASATFGQTVSSEEDVTGEFDAPDGIELERHLPVAFVPVPMIQMGVGLIKNTDLKIRFMPSVTTDDFKFKFYGFGLMHDFKQWTPGISHLPFDASVFVGWNQLQAEAKLGDAEVASGGQSQIGGYSIHSITGQIVVSKELSIFTFYGGFGFSHTTSNLEVLGTYDFEGTSDVTLQDGSTETVDTSFSLEDPLDIQFISSGPRATIGGRIKLIFLTIHMDYTFQEYNSATVGLGLTIR